MTHTPGPWGWTYDGSSTYSIGLAEDPQDRRIASVYDRRDERAIANCWVIAAAPEMLTALKAGLALLEHYGECEQVTAMRAAIARAEGRRT